MSQESEILDLLFYHNMLNVCKKKKLTSIIFTGKFPKRIAIVDICPNMRTVQGISEEMNKLQLQNTKVRRRHNSTVLWSLLYQELELEM